MKNIEIINLLRRFIFLVLGAALNGFAIGLCNQSGWGADAITVFYGGVSSTFNITVGVASTCTAIGMLILAGIIDWRQLGLGTLITPFFTQFGIDFAMGLIPHQQGWITFVMFACGLLLMAIGIAAMIDANLGKFSYDALILGLVDKMKKPFHMIRWTCDILLLVSGMILGGSVTIGTFVAIFALGKLIPFFTNQFNLRFKMQNKEQYS